MPTLYLMMGPPGSGKSHYRQKYLPDAHVISPDDIIIEWGKGTYDWNPKKAYAAWREAESRLEYEILAHAEGEGEHSEYVFDAVFQTRRRRKKYIRMAKDAGWRVVAVYVQTDLHTCLHRNSQRPPNRMVPEDQVRKMAATMTSPTRDEGFDDVCIVRGE